MDKIAQVHDKLFKETFGSVGMARDFINGYLPRELINLVDLDTLTPQKDSFINKELEEVFSDLLFRVDINKREGYIYFLFEHKSYKDKLAIFQLLRYMIEIWENKIIKENSDELPIVIPLLIYHHKDEWNLLTRLGEMITGYDELSEDIRKYIPNYEYLLYDLNKYNEEDIKLESITRIVIKIMKDVRYAEKNKVIAILEEGFNLLEEVVKKDTVTHYIESCLRYILSVRNDIEKEEMLEIAGKISVEGRELVMTTAERLIQEGMEKGIQEGMQKGMIKVAKNAIVKGMVEEEIMEITGLKKKDIDNIKKEMLQ